MKYHYTNNFHKNHYANITRINIFVGINQINKHKVKYTITACIPKLL